MHGESDLNIRKSIKEFISVLVDCVACLNRPHNISACLERGGGTSCGSRDTRPTWVLGSRTPLVCREDSEVL